MTDPKKTAKKYRRYFHDEGPDSQGRRRFTMTWEEPDGRFEPALSKVDGQPVGYRRAQFFFADPAAQTRNLAERGWVEEPNQEENHGN